ncbi:MAG: hypothetical protein IKY92_02530 [Akkermansia sp.]|nr:hypothetical protein [Akkermansia sp.]
MADTKNPEIKIDVKANVQDAKRPMDVLLELVNKQREAVAGSRKVLDEATKSQAEVQRVARELIAAAEAIGDDALKQRIADLFTGGIASAAKMESQVKHIRRESELLEKSSETVLMKMGSMQMPGGGDVETQVSKAAVALNYYSKRYDEMSQSSARVEQNMKSLGNAREMNNVVQVLVELKKRLEDVQKNSASGVEHTERMAAALRAEADAIEDGLPGAEQKRQALMREAEAYERIAEAQKALAGGSATRLDRVGEMVKQLGDGQVEQVAAGLKRLGTEVTAIEGRMRAADNAVQAQEQAKRVEYEKQAEREQKAAEAEAERKQKEEERARQEHERQMRREAEMREKMELAGMSKRELTAETLRLTEAMREAARVGNTELYEQLRRRMMAARSAQETMTRELQLAKIAGMQQVQTAQSMGQSIQMAAGAIANFAENAKAGRLDVMGMVNAFVSLQTAAKAGLGPLGAVLLAIQGLQMVWNYFAQERNAAAEKMRELEKAAVDADKALRAAQNALSDEGSEKRRIAAAEALTGQLQRQLDLLRETARQIDLNTEAELHKIAMTAQGDEQAVALKRLQVQAAYNRGEIDKFSMDEQMLYLNSDAEHRNRQRQLDAQNVRVMAAQAQADVRRDEYDAARWAERLSMDGFTMSEKKAAELEEGWRKAQADYNALGGAEKEAELERQTSNMYRRLQQLEGRMPAHKWKEKMEELEEMDKELLQLEEARQAVDVAYAEIPEFARLNGVQAYGKELNRRQGFNKGLDDTEAEKKKAWDEARVQAEAQAEALRRQDELFAQWSEGESALLNQRIADNADARRQDELKREHERRVARLKEDVLKLSESELQTELTRLRGLAGAEGDKREHERRESEAGVVLAEVGRRAQAEQKLREQLRGNEQAGSKAEAATIRDGVRLAVGVLENNDKYTAENIAMLERLVARANKTPGEADNEVLRRILRYMEAQAQAQAKSMAERAAMQQRVTELEQRMRASQRAIAR